MKPVEVQVAVRLKRMFFFSAEIVSQRAVGRACDITSYGVGHASTTVAGWILLIQTR